MHLLVIEDERALCETIADLRRLAYSVDYCYDGEGMALLGVDYDLGILI